MFSRLKSFEEESKMTFVTAIAEEVPLADVSLFIKSADNQPIPIFLKRIKKESDGRVLMLKGIGRMADRANSEDLFEVEVPESEPITVDQYEDARKKWPCYFYNHKEEPFDQNDATLKMDKLQRIFQERNVNSHTLDVKCSSICMIYDGKALLSTNFDYEQIIGHAVTDCVRQVSQSEHGYLCTGFTAYLLNEPCTSCAMALVHGRIRRVVILNSINEGPFSKYKMNYSKDLNHRFNVYFCTL